MEKNMIYDIKDNKQLCGLGKEFFEKNRRIRNDLRV